MTSELLSQYLPLVYILLVGLGVFWFVLTIFSRNEDMKALKWASGTEPVKSKSKVFELSRSLTHQFTLHHAVKIRAPKYRKDVEYTILTAGLRSEVNVDEFIGMQLLWGVLLPIVLTLLNLLLDLGFPWWAFILLAPFGFFMPKMHANAMRRERITSIRLDLPFFVDLLALSMEAGLDFQGAVQRIVERAKDKGSHLCEEFENFLRDLTMGDSRAKALRSLGYRCDMGEVNSFVNVIVDADQTGASIAKVLKDQSIQMRLERFVRAEKAGARASQLILLPLMLFILPAVFVMIFAPVALQFMYGGG